MLAAHDGSLPGAPDSYTYIAPGGADVLVIDVASPGVGRIRGTSGGTTIDETFTNFRSIVIDTGRNDGAGARNDSVRIVGPLAVAGLTAIGIETGAGDDDVTIEIGESRFPASIRVAVGSGDDRVAVALAAGAATSIAIDGGQANAGDRAVIRGTPAADTIAVAGSRITCGGVVVALASIENLTVGGGGGGDTITATGTTFTGTLALRGEAGNDSISLAYPLVAGSIEVDGGAAEPFSVIHAFQNGSGSAVPFGSVILHDGWLYGTTTYTEFVASAPDSASLIVDGGSIFRVRPDGGGFEVLKRFVRGGTDGYAPFHGLAVAGNRLVGTTQGGGARAGGTLYSVNVDGSDFRVLHDFGGADDGARPYAAPIVVGSILYGMTGFGGTNTGIGPLASLGAGVLYSYDTASGAYRVERNFAVPGANPFGSLLRIDDWLYGMVSGHRNTTAAGQVFRYRPADGAYEILHDFAGGSEGGYPYDTLAWDGGRYLYGTTLGFYPWHPLAPLDIAALADEGVIFRIDLQSPGYPYQVLHDFSAVGGDGGKPNSKMLVAPDGFLYGIAHGSEGLGATANGVRYGTELGTLYRLRPDGSGFTVLHTFDSLAAGLTPMRGLVWDNGSIYGTTAMGGIGVGPASRGSGTVWRYDVAAAEPSSADALRITLTVDPETVSLTASTLDIAGRSGLGFASFATVSLDTGAGADRVTIDRAAASGTAGSVAFVVVGGGGADTLTVLHTAPGATYDVRSFETLVGPDEDVVWSITGPGRGSCGAVTFSGARSLIGGSGRDVFRFANPSAAVGGRIDGRGGGDWLDYSALSSGVWANLATGVAARVGTRVAGIESLIGSARGGAWLVGGRTGGVIVGHGGGNLIRAGAGRSIVIGGLGRNVLVGGRDATILIDGSTRYDGDIDALDRLLASWRRPLPFQQSVTWLQSPTNPDSLRVDDTVTLVPARARGATPRLLIGNGAATWYLTRRPGGEPRIRRGLNAWTG